MKKAIVIVCLLLTTVFLCSCEKESSALAEGTLYVYPLFANTAPEPVSFVLQGELPPEDQESGIFSGYCQVTESDGTVHTYSDLQYERVDGWLLLRPSKPISEKVDELKCLIDPKDPERIYITDMSWSVKSPVLEIIAYVADDLSDTEVQALEAQIARIEGVEAVAFVSREEALEEFLAENEEAAAYLDITASDFSHSYCVTVNREIAERIAAQLETIPGIDRTHTDIWTPETIYFLAPEDSYEKLIAAMALLPQSNSSSEH